MSRRQKAQRDRVRFREGLQLAQDYWDGGAGDGFGSSIALIAMTSLWYRVAGAPVSQRQAAAARRRASGMQDSGSAVVLLYAAGVVGLVFLVGIVVGVVVLVL